MQLRNLFKFSKDIQPLSDGVIAAMREYQRYVPLKHTYTLVLAKRASGLRHSLRDSCALKSKRHEEIVAAKNLT